MTQLRRKGIIGVTPKWRLIQSASTAGTTATTINTVTLNCSATQAGNVIVVGFNFRGTGANATAITITDNKLNTYVDMVGIPFNNGVAAYGGIWYCAAPTAGVTIIVVHITTAATNVPNAAMAEFSSHTAVSLDSGFANTNSAQATTVTPIVTSRAAGFNNCLCLTLFCAQPSAVMTYDAGIGPFPLIASVGNAVATRASTMGLFWNPFGPLIGNTIADQVHCSTSVTTGAAIAGLKGN